jgi:hypothetical protein
MLVDAPSSPQSSMPTTATRWTRRSPIGCPARRSDKSSKMPLAERKAAGIHHAYNDRRRALPVAHRTGPHDHDRLDRDRQDHADARADRADARAARPRGRVRPHRGLRRGVLQPRDRHHPQPDGRALPELVGVRRSQEPRRLHRDRRRPASRRRRGRRTVLDAGGAHAVRRDLHQAHQAWPGYQPGARQPADDGRPQGGP